MNVLDAIQSEIGGEALDALSRSLQLSHKQCSKGVYCSASALVVALILRVEKGSGMPSVETPIATSWEASLLGAGYPGVLNTIAAFSQTTPVQAAKLLEYAASALPRLLEGRIHPGQEDTFIRDIYPQKEALMSTLPANVVAALDLTYLQAGMARDFGSRHILHWAWLFLALALLLFLLLRC